MKRRDAPLNCRKSEVDDLPVIECGLCGRDVYPTVDAGVSLGGDPDPLCAANWVCPTRLCRGPFEP